MYDGIRDISIGSIVEKYGCSHIDNDILVIDDFRNLLKSSEPGRMNCVLMAVCLKGSATYDVDATERTVRANDVIVISHNQIVGGSRLSDDCEGLGLLLSYDFFHETVKDVHEMSSLFIFSRFHPVYTLSEQEVGRICTYVDMIREKVADTSHRFRKATVRSLISTMLYDVSDVLYRSQVSLKRGNTSAEKIFAEFLRLVESNFVAHRKLSWYGEQLCITPKYLYGAVKSVSHCTPTDWIDSYVTMEIKVMLRNSTKSIKEIAQELNFSSQSFLGKYFKEKTGVSPKEYRRS